MEGLRLRNIYFASRATWKGDLLWTLIAFAGMAVTMPQGSSTCPSLVGGCQLPERDAFPSAPLAAVYPLFLLMPTTQALAELPTYWGYVAPRLRAFGMNRWVVVILVGCVLSLQAYCSLLSSWIGDTTCGLR